MTQFSLFGRADHRRRRRLQPDCGRLCALQTTTGWLNQRPSPDPVDGPAKCWAARPLSTAWCLALSNRFIIVFDVLPDPDSARMVSWRFQLQEITFRVASVEPIVCLILCITYSNSPSKNTPRLLEFAAWMGKIPVIRVNAIHYHDLLPWRLFVENFGLQNKRESRTFWHLIHSSMLYRFHVGKVRVKPEILEQISFLGNRLMTYLAFSLQCFISIK